MTGGGNSKSRKVEKSKSALIRSGNFFKKVPASDQRCFCWQFEKSKSCVGGGEVENSKSRKVCGSEAGTFFKKFPLLSSAAFDGNSKIRKVVTEGGKSKSRKVRGSEAGTFKKSSRF